MISKYLAIAAAIAFLSGANAGHAFAQQNNQPAATAPAAAPDAGTPAANSNTAAAPAGAPGAAPATPAPDAAAPPPAPDTAASVSPPTTPASATASKDSPYGLGAMWAKGDWVLRTVLVILGIMSAGTWYIFFMKFWEQSRVISHSKVVERRFWSSANLNEGIDKLPKNSLFRSVAESGVRSSSGQATGLVNLNDWIAMSLNRQLEEANSRLQGGIAFLASVGSVAPFVGLFGTVWGILNALIAIGVAGQASIDKVAGPVGQALIATAIGLVVAVPAVLCYNFLVRRNKVINERLRSFASDLQTYLITNKK
ncbi:MAG TPA: MotA/TolQ/ExbB proton channel family protein [Rhizomicrobium sp.]|jgi:biopolymer transport protein ExbB